MIKCPECAGELPQEVITQDYWKSEEICCSHCNKTLTKTDLKLMMIAEDCFACQEGNLEKDDFNPEYDCDDCMQSECIFAGSDILSDFGYVQDEENNWCYPEDIDEEL